MDEAAPSAPAAWLPMGAADEVGGLAFGCEALGLPRMGMRTMLRWAGPDAFQSLHGFINAYVS